MRINGVTLVACIHTALFVTAFLIKAISGAELSLPMTFIVCLGFSVLITIALDILSQIKSLREDIKELTKP